jgi:hypothetical protein
MKIRVLGVALAALFAVTATASAHTPKTITIRHQVRHCHAWSFDGSAYKATLRVRLDRDTSLMIVNNDVMPHKLIQVAGPKAKVSTANMNHLAAKAWVSFTRAGTYTFRTRAGEDYLKGMKTIGEDNVLRLVVTVR